jgi:hypothetical protein
MDFWVWLTSSSWVLIPITAILAGVVSDALKVRAKQKVLTTSNSELEKSVAALKRTNEELAHRLQNLETIVVSRTWNAVSEPGLSETDRERRVAAAVRHEIPPPPIEDVNRQRAEQLARQLQR